VFSYYITKKPGEYRVPDDNFGTEEYGVAGAISTKWFGKDIIVK
jgi:hypothetical protein